MTAAQKGTVYLVGAGPGDPELLTVKATRLLATADLVLHDDLVSAAVMEMVGDHALAMNVGKRCGDAKRMRQVDIHTLMVDGARRGLSVVRLKSGDPLIFGRAAEEMDALSEAQIPFEVVPGITAAFAAAAAIACSLTDRRSASSVEFQTGHRCVVDEGQQAEPASATRVVYMPGRDYRELADAWVRAGDPPDLPCCVISRAAQPDQHVQWTTLAELPNQPAVAAPSLLLAGWALARRMPGAYRPVFDPLQRTQTDTTGEQLDDRT
jgi:uroporphyrin-III C-methyltransferase